VLGEDGQISAQRDLQSVLQSSQYARELFQTQNGVEQTKIVPYNAKHMVPVATILNNTQSDSMAVRTTTVSPSGDISPPIRHIGTLQYYLSSMGRKAVLRYAAIVTIQTGCGTAQRKFNPVPFRNNPE
jgi:hypothetical protein